MSNFVKKSIAFPRFLCEIQGLLLENDYINTDSQNVEYDNPNMEINRAKYNNYLHIITYDIPN